jgi:hypothetical protein
MSTANDVMRLGCNVIVDVNGDKLSFIRLREDCNISVGGDKCSADPLVGAPYGAAFLLNHEGELERTEFNPHDQIEEATETEKVRANI